MHEIGDVMAVPDLESQVNDLVVANRILANEGVVDAYGHISVRHPADPARFLQSRSRSPQLVSHEDVMQFDLDGTCVDATDDRPGYLERFIHGAIYQQRPDVHSVVHAHTEALLPFGITETPLVPVIHSGSEMGSMVPKWDIREVSGEDTDLLVTTTVEAEHLARRLGDHSVVLMRGHGFAAAERSTRMLVGLTVYLAKNARVLAQAMMMGPVAALTEGEVAGRERTPGSNFDPDSPGVRRNWEYWTHRAGCSDLLDGGYAKGRP